MEVQCCAQAGFGFCGGAGEPGYLGLGLQHVGLQCGPGGRRGEGFSLIGQLFGGCVLAAAGEYLGPSCPPPGLDVEVAGPSQCLGFFVTCSASSRRPWAWTASARFGSSLRRNQSCSLTARSASHPCLSSSHRRCGPSRPGGFLGSEHAPPQRPRAWGNSTYFTQAAGPSGGARWRSGPRHRTPPVLIIGLGPTAGDRDPGPGLRWPDELGRCRGSAAGQRSGPSGTAELLCALSYGSGLAVAERMAHGTNTAFAGCRQRSRRTSRSSRHGGGDCRAGWWMKVRRVVSR